MSSKGVQRPHESPCSTHFCVDFIKLCPRPGREGRQGGRGGDGGHAEAASADRQRQPLRLGRALAALLALLGGGRRPGRALGDERAAGGAAEEAGMTRYANF